MGDVNLEIKLSNLDERVIKIEEGGSGSGGSDYITSVSNDFNVVNKKLLLSNDITTKLSKVDDKIDKPASATNGQVLTYNGTSNEWEAKNPSASITEPTDLERGIIGGDEWVSGGSYTIGESVVIDENKLYLLVGDGGSTTKPSTDTTHSIWEETSISALNSKLSSIQYYEFIINEDISTSQWGNWYTARKTLTIPNIHNAKNIQVTYRGVTTTAICAIETVNENSITILICRPTTNTTYNCIIYITAVY